MMGDAKRAMHVTARTDVIITIWRTHFLSIFCGSVPTIVSFFYYFFSFQDITVSPKIFDEIKQIEKERGVTIITGGIGGYKRPKVMLVLVFFSVELNSCTNMLVTSAKIAPSLYNVFIPKFTILFASHGRSRKNTIFNVRWLHITSQFSSIEEGFLFNSLVL